jgi:AraC-like DNA-binding protein
MGANGYLALQLVRLRGPETWEAQGDGLYLVFPQGGAGKYLSEVITQDLGPGDVLVVNGTSGGKVCASNKGELVFRCFSLCFEHMFPLFANEEISHLQTVSQAFKGAKLYSSSTALAGECHRLLGDVSSRFNLDHRIQLLRVFAAILDLEFKTARPKRDGFVRADEHMVRVFERLSTREMLELSVGDLADKFGCSRRHLNRLFHEHFGVSVAALRMEMRLLKAASLLRVPDTKVINVAEECGFNHLGLFNTCFKRRFGASPGQWRKTSAQAESQPVQPVNNPVPCPLQPSGLCPLTGNSDVRKPAAGEAIETRKTALARVVFGKQIPDAGAGLDLVAGQRKVAGTASRQNLVQPRP